MEKHRMRVNHGVPTEMLRAIGDFVVSFAQIEYALKLGIQTLVQCSAAHKRVITGHRDVASLIIMLREIYRTSETQRVPVATVDALCDDADQIRSFRNHLMHSMLVATGEATLEMEKKKRDSYSLNLKEVTLSELEVLTSKSQFVAGDLIGIWMGYHTITPPVL